MTSLEQPNIENKKENIDLPRRDFLKKLALLGALGALPSKELFAQQTESPELSVNAGLKEISDFITKHKETVDYAKLWDRGTPVLFVGERHTVMSDKDEVIKNLPILKKIGMTHFAMEMLREEHQQTVNDYLDGKIPSEKILKIFKDSWGAKGPGIPEKYMELIDAVKLNGMRILAIDLPALSDRGGSDFARLQPLSSSFFRKRNANWARIAESILKNKEARILFYCGFAHSGYNKIHDSANEILGGMGIRSKVIEFAGGEIAPQDPHFFIDKIAKVAEGLKIGGQKFGFRVSPDDDVRGMDYVIHLPQIEKSIKS